MSYVADDSSLASTSCSIRWLSIDVSTLVNLKVDRSTALMAMMHGNPTPFERPNISFWYDNQHFTKTPSTFTSSTSTNWWHTTQKHRTIQTRRLNAYLQCDVAKSSHFCIIELLLCRQYSAAFEVTKKIKHRIILLLLLCYDVDVFADCVADRVAPNIGALKKKRESTIIFDSMKLISLCIALQKR